MGFEIPIKESFIEKIRDVTSIYEEDAPTIDKADLYVELNNSISDGSEWEIMGSQQYKYLNPPPGFDVYELALNENFCRCYKTTEQEWLEYWQNAFSWDENETKARLKFKRCQCSNCNCREKTIVGDFVTRLRRNFIIFSIDKKYHFLLNVDHWLAALNLRGFPRYNCQSDVVTMLDKLQQLIGNKIDQELDIKGEINAIKNDHEALRNTMNLYNTTENKIEPILNNIQKELDDYGSYAQSAIK